MILSDRTIREAIDAGRIVIDPFDPDSFKEPAIMSGTTAPAQDKPHVKLLVFDMGHVFVDFTWADVCKGFYERAGMTVRTRNLVLQRPLGA